MLSQVHVNRKKYWRKDCWAAAPGLVLGAEALVDPWGSFETMHRFGFL